MTIPIPLAGDCEITKLKSEFFWDSCKPEEEFTVIKKDNSEFWICDPSVSFCLCKDIFWNDKAVEVMTDFLSPSYTYWALIWYEENESTASETVFSEIFDLYLRHGFIKKVSDAHLSEITENGDDFVYVYSPSYNPPDKNVEKEKNDIIRKICRDFYSNMLESNEDELELRNSYELVLKGLSDLEKKE